MSLTKQISIVVGLGVSLVLLVVLFAQVDWALFFQEAAKLKLWTIPVTAGLIVLSFWLRALRWRLLLPTGLDVSTKHLYNGLVLGTLASYVLPLRAGEFVRPWVLSRSQPVSFSLGFASVVTERVFDVVTMLALLVACLSKMEHAPEIVVLGAKALGVVAGAILLLMCLAYFNADAMLKLLNFFLQSVFRERGQRLQNKIYGMGTEFVAGLRAISNFQELVLVLVWSACIWFSYSLTFHVVMLGLGESSSLWVANTITVMVALAVAAPSAPGFLGTFQFGCVAALHYVYGYSETFALAYSVVAHALQFVFTVLLGIFSLRSEGIGWKELRQHGSTE